MEWALGDFPGVNDLVEYETRLNYLLPCWQHPVICVYDSSRFGAGLALDILRTHPSVILGMPSSIKRRSGYAAPASQQNIVVLRRP